MSLDRRIVSILYHNGITDVNKVEKFLGENNNYYEVIIDGKVEKLKIPGNNYDIYDEFSFEVTQNKKEEIVELLTQIVNPDGTPYFDQNYIDKNILVKERTIEEEFLEVEKSAKKDQLFTITEKIIETQEIKVEPKKEVKVEPKKDVKVEPKKDVKVEPKKEVKVEPKKEVKKHVKKIDDIDDFINLA